MRNLVPRFILEKFAAGEEHGTLPALILFVDISGFTPLTETLCQHQHDGAEVLSETLTQVFQPMVQAVYACGGFISHFSGDAFTAVFPAHAPDAAEKAWWTAAAIQRHLTPDGQTYTAVTPYGQFVIGANVGLAAGDVFWGIPGHAGKYTWYFRGPAVDQAAQAEKIGAQGQVIAHESCRRLLGEGITAVGQPHPGYWQLAIPSTSPPVPQVAPPLAAARQALQPFIGQAVLDLTLPADFRVICPVFISFQASSDVADLHDFAAHVMHLSHAYGGTFSRLEFGDKGGLVVVWFGAPLSYEDNTARAVRFLLALRAQPSLVASSQSLNWRAGLAEGLVWAGIRGGEQRGEYSTLGDVVNTAAHVAMQAAWGEIWLDSTAVPQLENEYHLQPLGPRLLKGQRPRELYQLLTGKVRHSLLFRGQMVGRMAELNRLQQAAAPLHAGQFAGVVWVHGDAGMGKSRLLFAWQQASASQMQWLTCPADGILRHPLNPFRAMLQAYFHQTANRSLVQNRRSFDEGVANLQQQLTAVAGPRAAAVKAELARTQSLLAALVDIYWPGSLYEQLEPRLRFENTLLALHTFLQAQALCRPLALHLEDAHWLDEESRHFVAHLCHRLADYPVMMILSSRYQEDGTTYALPEGTAVPQTHIHLTALTTADLHTLCHQVTARPVAADVVHFLQEKSDGNPFFAEQLCLDLQERDLLTATDTGTLTLVQADVTTLPASLNTLLITRLDRLPAPTKKIVQTAAVLGQSFAVPVLKAMLPDDERVTPRLQQAETRHIWALLGDLRYLFKHALLRDAAYEMQPRAHRRVLHARAAAALAHVYGQDQALHYGELAYHYEMAFQLGQVEAQASARWYLYQAGLFAAKHYETTTALDYYGRALALTASEDAALLGDLLLAQEEVHDWQGDRAAQREDLTALAVLGPQLSWQQQTAVALRRSRYENILPNMEKALSFAQQAVTLALSGDNLMLQAHAYRRLGMVQFRQRHYAAAAATLQQALTLARMGDDMALITRCLNNLGMALDEQGFFEQARPCYDEALTWQQQGGDLYGETITLNNLGWQAFMQDNVVAARHYYERAYQLSRQIGHKMEESNGATNVGIMAFLEGDFGRAEHFTRHALLLCLETGNRRGEANLNANLALLAVYQGAYAEALTYAQTAVAMGAEWGGKYVMSEGYLYLGHVYRLQGQLAAAEEAYQQALTIRLSAQRASRTIEPRAGLAQLALARNDLAAAAAQVEAILADLTADKLSGELELFWVYQVCCEVLFQVDQARAKTILTQAYKALQDKVQKLEDQHSQEMFLQNFPAHRRLVDLWTVQSGERIG